MKLTIVAVIVTALLVACASKPQKPANVVPGQAGASIGEGPASSPSAAEATGIQDSRIMDLSGIDASEQAGWMNPNNPPNLKRQYQRGQFSVLLPEDLYPVTTEISSSAALFKFRGADAYIYVFFPSGIQESALLDINLNSLDLTQSKGFHDMTVDLKDGVLKVSYRNDGSNDGYVRYVEAKKQYQAGRMSVVALIVRDQGHHDGLQGEYRALLSAIKPPLD